ncbi:helix-turn-helix transcriptional regulator [Ferrimonas sp. SCSIO 43195]|uniref:AraC family transcriptional regulator n=1 Tax=Ferrimonas sp. SCSIO 43195 TaxID=2822844 RepID=UPI002076279D|nr:helix-turn-helix transcriptional regulator [Ferrimonas sp. SCSIO 43195]USD39270.1 helix-turn-helix transcriptional regulator [Ferrimonas sp. SCSIO 43195]
MAILSPNARFDADALPQAVIGIATDVGQHDSGVHRHRKSQLLFAAHGCMSISLQDRHTVLPPTCAAWIPAGIDHCARMRNVVAYRSIYFDTAQFEQAPTQLQVCRVNPLLSALIERMALWPWEMDSAKQQLVLALFWQELAAAEQEQLSLPMPTDPRLAAWLESLHLGALPNPLNQLAAQLGMSEKTLSRLFSRHTGMPYQSWRQQWRVLRALELLSEGQSVSRTADALAFASDSAFIAFFRQHRGMTPRQYQQR